MIDPGAIAVTVLAGGEGSRIGGAKPLAKLGGRTLIERACDRAGRWSGTAIVAVRSPAQLGSCPLPWIEDAKGIEGPLAGLAASLEWSLRRGAEALLTIACDMPFLPDDLMKRLAAEIGNCSAAVASSGGELHPVCSLWRIAAADELSSYCATGRRSLRGFAAHVGFVEVQWPAAPLDPFYNINTPADLAAAEAILDA